MRVIQSPTHFVGAPFAQGGLLCFCSMEASLLGDLFYVVLRGSPYTMRSLFMFRYAEASLLGGSLSMFVLRDMPQKFTL